MRTIIGSRAFSPSTAPSWATTKFAWRPETYAPTEEGSGSQYAAWVGNAAADEPVWFFTVGGEPEGVLEGYRAAGRHVEKRDALFGDARELGTITAYYGRLKAPRSRATSGGPDATRRQ